MRRIRIVLVVFVAAVLLVAPAQGKREPGPPFNLNIFPWDEPIGARPALVGQRLNFLVTVDDSDPAAGPIRIAVKVTDKKATVTMTPNPLPAGVVGELTIVPDRPKAGYDEDRFLVEVTGTRQGWISRDWRTQLVFNDVDSSQDMAREYLALFLPWLQSEHPELGVTAATKWEVTAVAPALIVSHYLFFTPDLEVGLVWHNTWGGEWDDWAAIYVRHRWTDYSPSLAAKIDSVEHLAESPAHAIAPPPMVMRTTDFMMWGPPENGH
jgi:hypothetical protein